MIRRKPYLKPSEMDFEPRHKTKGRGGTAKKFRTKKVVIEEERRVSFKLKEPTRVMPRFVCEMMDG